MQVIRRALAWLIMPRRMRQEHRDLQYRLTSAEATLRSLEKDRRAMATFGHPAQLRARVLELEKKLQRGSFPFTAYEAMPDMATGCGDIFLSEEAARSYLQSFGHGRGVITKVEITSGGLRHVTEIARLEEPRGSGLKTAKHPGTGKVHRVKAIMSDTGNGQPGHVMACGIKFARGEASMSIQDPEPDADLCRTCYRDAAKK